MFAASKTASLSGYQIQRSLRFNSADSAYLNRTPASVGNRRTWTFSAWVKAPVGLSLFSAGASDAQRSQFGIEPSLSNVLYYYENSGSKSAVSVYTSAFFRDPSAWYHFVLAFDTTQATDSNRVKIYVNGVQQTINTSVIWPTQNYDSCVNNTVPQLIGQYPAGGNFNGYMTEVNFIDGQALTPSSFGITNPDTGVWQPKAYTGTYGTNGFYLNFSDNSNTTATTLGKDYSGNGNNWTPNNFSVSAGAGNDSLVDVPTPWGTDTGVGGTVRGNYCTLNPLSVGSVGLSNGNLSWANTTNNQGCIGTIETTVTGKWYVEFTVDYLAGGYELYVGVNTSVANLADGNRGSLTAAYAYAAINGNKLLDNSGSAYGASYTTNDVIGIALDKDNNTLTFYKNGVSQGQIASVPSSKTMFWAGGGGGSAANSYGGTFNFGQRPFAYTAPSGFKALCTQNLPAGTITTSGTFIGNGSADGPFVYLNGVPTAMTINGNAVTFATHADKLSNGFKVRTTSASYNNNGASNSYSITTTGDKFKYALAQPNP